MGKFKATPRTVICPQYRTEATLRVDESHTSGMAHLVVDYASEKVSGRKTFKAAIPDDWTDGDIDELIAIQLSKPTPSDRRWPAWEVPARDFGSVALFRWWKGERPK